MNITQSIESFYSDVPVISDNKNYWLIRTSSGEYYESFIKYSYIALGYNEISLEAVNTLKTSAKNNGEAIKNLKNLVIETYRDKEKEEKRPGLIANQLFTFTYDIKKGDIVVIPSRNSDEVYFGIVEESFLSNSDQHFLDFCPFNRRKKVKWVKQMNRSELEPSLFKIFFSHLAVNNITSYGNQIEANLSNYFVRGGEEHLIFNIQKKEDIGAIDLFQLGFYLLSLTESFFEENELEFSINDFDVKVNLNSKGKLKFITKYGKGAFMLALITVFINGGGGTISYGNFNMDIKSDGLIQKIIDYQNNKFDQEMVKEIKESMDSLQIENPEDALELYRQFSVNKRTEGKK